MKIRGHKMDIISTFPVPNTRADLLDFLTMLQSRVNSLGSRDGSSLLGQEDLSYACWLLYTNCINKAKLSFSKDKDFKPYFLTYDEEVIKRKGIIGYLRRNPRLSIILLILSTIVFLLYLEQQARL